MEAHDINMTLKIGDEEVEITATVKCAVTPAESPVYYGANPHNGSDGRVEVLDVNLSVWGDDNKLMASYQAPEWLRDYFYRSEEVKRMIMEATP